MSYIRSWWREALLATFTLCYLLPFVRRGWVPHDEGTIAGDAVRLLGDELPHVGFEDPYTGGMTWFYAGLFWLLGTDAVWIRWALLCAAVLTVVVWYRITLRFASPPVAMGVAFTSLLWSFPNYFAGLPSWWNVSFVSVAALAMMQHAENGRRRWLLLAGFWLGVASAFKQTGIYLVAAAILVLFHDEQRSRHQTSALPPSTWVRVATVAMCMAGAMFVIGAHPTLAVIVIVLAPILLVCLYVVADARRSDRASWTPRRWLKVGGVFAVGYCMPLVAVAAPYVISSSLPEFLYGALVLPQQRSSHAALDLPSLWLSIALVPPLVGVASWAASGRLWSDTWTLLLAWLMPPVILVAYRSVIGYQLIWNAYRSGAALATLAAVVWLWKADRRADTHARPLYILATTTAFIGLYQIPFAAPIYLCYVAPFAILTLFSMLSVSGSAARRVRLPLLAGMALFASLSLNRGYIWNLGLKHSVANFDTELGLARAHLKVSKEDWFQYRRLVELVRVHARGAHIHAFPDCPEVYFLTNTDNPTPANFEFFHPSDVSETRRLWDVAKVALVVVNHRPRFSPRPSGALLTEVRNTFPHAETAGQFEIRWR